MNPRDILSAGAVVPVMSIDNIDTAVDLANALVEGGIPTLEITLRTEHGLKAIELIKKEVKGAIVGAGTVTNPDQLKAVEDAGAQFAISPGLHQSLAKAAGSSGIPLIPGVATPGEVQLALEYGIDTLKLFPAEVVGGKAMLKALYGPYAHVRFCPTGGITPETAPEYLKLPNVLCVGGTWLTPKTAVANKDWATITRLAQEASTLK
ncbi:MULTISPECIES: bifunctional 4-hydroxy-2-oxoglutarate aldolase/2-dehydro-3-deoxy-phosphogluconate aldolase [unclassified Neisseria]|uniref:bifunctional 4-hydroxy-2-oxoglutarate aldolase/2-dehydro-3-deoxy-phosphogluconate aldolase n=1 Tax=unclassified Neisseria TaxID=2623750 RepID=UPI0010715E3F|nr:MULTISPECIES: bifunctional 4-hydroxy-2-oxoglutarate aldolase/2-dehydro-3-deoxy-phosphogluconate aldolase [unclassified Neisseria]MBF0804694.1 bifunctional 4-hydroxy-2-oxoglutarate aldolase/2-dehydro-3-deoxy-phosphogluconate aldolase [Neisseria sp. 19428wB4_WF04]TFU40301.1 bifunctional 4-hydroxy-2-oxoglutarate aldolase/2-dehydro-3-deoxy-phosphogluconate aldolase [Neisseria sp. WF04]